MLYAHKTKPLQPPQRQKWERLKTFLPLTHLPTRQGVGGCGVPSAGTRGRRAALRRSSARFKDQTTRRSSLGAGRPAARLLEGSADSRRPPGAPSAPALPRANGSRGAPRGPGDASRTAGEVPAQGRSWQRGLDSTRMHIYRRELHQDLEIVSFPLPPSPPAISF